MSKETVSIQFKAEIEKSLKGMEGVMVYGIDHKPDGADPINLLRGTLRYLEKLLGAMETFPDKYIDWDKEKIKKLDHLFRTMLVYIQSEGMLDQVSLRKSIPIEG